MNMCIKEHLSKRELERQIDSGYYERYMLLQKKLKEYIELAGTVAEEEKKSILRLKKVML